MTVALICAGQGAERPGSAVELAEASRPTGELLARASAATGLDLVRALRRGDPVLDRTEVVQPLLAALSLGVARELLDAGLRPELVAGHSAGEVAAVAIAGWLGFDEAVDLAHFRGKIMAREAERRPGRMLAVFVDSEGAALEAVELGRERGAVDLAGHNGPGEWVLTGDERALRRVAGALPSAWLPVAGAWHGPAMAGAVEELGDELRARLRPRRGSWPKFVSDGDGEVIEDHDQLAGVLAEQLVRPVRLAAVFATLSREGVRDLVVAGPGKALGGLARTNLDPTVAVHPTGDPRDLGRTKEALCP